MLSTSANLITKALLTSCILITTATIYFYTHNLVTNNHHTISLLRRRFTNEETKYAYTKKSHGGLLELIANVTQTVIAIETQAQRLEEEFERMRQKTRQLLWQRRKDALWSEIHKCFFFYGCNKYNFSPQVIICSV